VIEARVPHGRASPPVDEVTRPRSRARAPAPTPADAAGRAWSSVPALVLPAPLHGDAADLGARAAQAVALARAVEALEPAFGAWERLREERRQALARLEAEGGHLAEQGRLVLGALEVSGQPPPALREAQANLDAAGRAVAQRLDEARDTYAQALQAIQDELLGRIAARATSAPPTLRLILRRLGAGRSILHARRPTGDESVLLLHALAGRMPSRYGFLTDDSTDDVTREPGVLYPDGDHPLRPDAPELSAVLSGLGPVWPVKGMLPQWVGPRLHRWRCRGPVLEAEVAEPGGFRSVLEGREAEALTGALLSLQAEGRLRLELVSE
jgi:hypothetical protein